MPSLRPNLFLKQALACAKRGCQGDATDLKDLARYAGSLAAKDEALSADRNFHLNKVVQIADYVGPLNHAGLVSVAARAPCDHRLKRRASERSPRVGRKNQVEP